MTHCLHVVFQSRDVGILRVEFTLNSHEFGLGFGEFALKRG